MTHKSVGCGELTARRHFLHAQFRCACCSQIHRAENKVSPALVVILLSFDLATDYIALFYPLIAFLDEWSVNEEKAVRCSPIFVSSAPAANAGTLIT